MKKQVRAGAFVHMPPKTPHILAKTPVAMLLLMLKQVRLEKAKLPRFRLAAPGGQIMPLNTSDLSASRGRRRR